MPQILSEGAWLNISDVISREDGQIMSFKVNTKEHGLVTVEANVPWKEWEAFLNFFSRGGGGAAVGSAFGPLGALVGAAAGIVSFFKTYEEKRPGYVHRASGSHYFGRFYNVRDRSYYRAT